MLLVAGERAVGGHLGEDALQRDARAARDAECARDLALACFALRRVQKFEDLFFARQTAIGGNARCALRFAARCLPS
jgi:hypothetical protein